MDNNNKTPGNCSKVKENNKSKKKSLRFLRISLKYRPKLFRLIIKLRYIINKKNREILDIRKQLKNEVSIEKTNVSCQTEFITECNLENNVKKSTEELVAWKLDEKNGGTEKSIAEQVKEAAQSALSQSGMVYVESAGMYYDYKTGYYYNSELGLYYHPTTNCYYYYKEDKQEFVFHSYPDTSKISPEAVALQKHEKRKAKKHKQDKEDDATDTSKPKKKKTKPKPKEGSEDPKVDDENKTNKDSESNTSGTDSKTVENNDLEDGECSDTDSEGGEVSDVASNDSTSTDSDDESVAKHHPPCMRIIVRETNLPKLKVGTLFIVTKDGGTIGREGDHHTILIKDHNISRNHLDISYDMNKRMYTATDLGSKNGTILNGTRMSESQERSQPLEIQHSSTIQLGETKLLCHIHLGNDTCGHCEPGLIMEADDKNKKVAYTRTCSVQKQHQLELARLKNKYAPEPLAIEEGTYVDRAKARRETVGSSHDSEKTQQSDLNSTIAPDNKGFQLLKKMGWSKGEGLGKDNQGDTEPIPLVSNDSKAGLGAAGSAVPVTVGSVGSVPMKMAKRTKPLRPPAKLFRDPLEEDDED